MGLIADKFRSAFRDYTTDGVPGSGEYEPAKKDIRAIGLLIEQALTALSLGGTIEIAYATEAELQGDLMHAEGTLGLVYNDPDQTKIDVWTKSGGAGLGGWQQTGLLHADAKTPLLLTADTYAEIEPELGYAAGKVAFVSNDPNPDNNGFYVKAGGVGVGGWEFSKLSGYWIPIYKPDQDLFYGALAFGDGLRNLSHAAGEEGWENIAIGINAGLLLENGWGNTLVGANAGAALTDRDTVNGYGGVLGNVGNTFIGRNCAPVANGALDNTFVGANVGLNATNCMDNAAMGINALQQIAGGSENACLGHGALQYMVGGGTVTNVDTPDLSGPNASWGHRMVAVGDMAGRFLSDAATQKTSGKNSIYIGAQAFSGANYAVNEIVIGYKGRGLGSNTVVIGNSATTQQRLPGNVCGGNGALSIPPLAPFHAYNTSSAGLLSDGFRASRPGASTAFAFMAFNTGDTAYFGGVFPGTKAQIAFRVSDGTSHIDALTIKNDGRAEFAETVKTKAYTVAALPSAATVGAGARAFVTDATGSTFGTALAGGGAIAVPVYSDGTDWRIG